MSAAGQEGSGAAGDSENDQKLAQFISITGAAEGVAKHWLEANAYSLESAVNMFMESNVGGSGAGGGSMGHASSGAGGNSMGRAEFGPSGFEGTDNGSGARSDSAAGLAQAAGGDPNDPDYVRPADPYKRQRLVDDPRSHQGGYGGTSVSRPWRNPSATNPFRDFAQESRQASHSFAVKEGNISSEPAVAEKQRKLAAMFAPPTEIMFMGDFQAARQMAKQQKKWLLVNIQADAEFDCHRLNRDVWKDEMVQNIIACNCIFWQQPSVSEEAKTYCRRYDAGGYPHISLIDPRTGLKVWDFQGFLASMEFVEKVTDVTDKISLEDGVSTRLPPPPPRPPQLPPNTSGSEDQMIAAAIAASLQKSSSRGDDDDAAHSNECSDQPDLKKFKSGPGFPQRPPPPREDSSGSGGSFGGFQTSSSSSLSSSNGSRGTAGGVSSAGSTKPEARKPPAGGVVDIAEEDDEEEEEDQDEDYVYQEHDKEEDEDIMEDDDFVEDVAVLSAEPLVSGAGTGPGRSGAGSSGSSWSLPSSSGNKGKGKARGTGVENGGGGAGGDRAPAEVVDVSGEVVRNGSGGAPVSNKAEAEATEVLHGETLEAPPEDDSLEKTSVRFQFPTGQRVVRKFRKRSNVRQLYLFVASELEGAKTKAFDVRTIRPPSSMSGMKDTSIEEAGLSNSTVVVVWAD